MIFVDFVCYAQKRFLQIWRMLFSLLIVYTLGVGMKKIKCVCLILDDLRYSGLSNWFSTQRKEIMHLQESLL